MGKISKKVSPDALIEKVENRIEELSSASSSEIIGSVSGSRDEVVKYFRDKLGWDTSDPEVSNYADAVAEYIDIANTAGPYSMDDWYEDTKHNAPEDLEQFNKDVESCDTVTSAEEPVDEDIIEEIIRYATDEVYGRHGDIIDDVDMVYHAAGGKAAILTTVTLDDRFDNKILDFAVPISMLELDGDHISDDGDFIADDIDMDLDDIYLDDDDIEESTSITAAAQNAKDSVHEFIRDLVISNVETDLIPEISANFPEIDLSGDPENLDPTSQNRFETGLMKYRDMYIDKLVDYIFTMFESK